MPDLPPLAVTAPAGQAIRNATLVGPALDELARMSRERSPAHGS